MDAQILLVAAAAAVFGTLLGIVIGRSSREKTPAIPEPVLEPVQETLEFPYVLLNARMGTEWGYLVVPFQPSSFDLPWNHDDFRTRYAPCVSALGIGPQDLRADDTWSFPTPDCLQGALRDAHVRTGGDPKKIAVVLAANDPTEVPLHAGPKVVRATACATLKIADQVVA